MNSANVGAAMTIRNHLSCFRQAHLSTLPFPTNRRLTTAGLPESAAPFLDFRVPDHGAVQTVAKLWQLAPEYNRYRVIGSNGSGDPLCIDESFDGQIVYLNHDFDFHRVLINSSVPQLAESLLAFRHLIRETQRRNGEDAYLTGDVPSDVEQWLFNEIMRIDPAAVDADCFLGARIGEHPRKRKITMLCTGVAVISVF